MARDALAAGGFEALCNAENILPGLVHVRIGRRRAATLEGRSTAEILFRLWRSASTGTYCVVDDDFTEAKVVLEAHALRMRIAARDCTRAAIFETTLPTGAVLRSLSDALAPLVARIVAAGPSEAMEAAIARDPLVSVLAGRNPFLTSVRLPDQP